MNEELIRSIPPFSILPEREITSLAESLSPREYPADSLLMREGERANNFFILIEGQVEIIKALGTSDERLLAVREAGTFIGEMGLLSEDGLHTATVRAQTPISLLEMTRAEFEALLHRQPSLAYEMGKTLSQRLNASENATIRVLRRKNRELTKAYRELESAQVQLIEKERLERELEVAREIQSSILPRTLPDLTGYDFGALMVPMSAVGGDFFDFIPLGDDRLGLVVGDVSDHGVPAALFMAMTVTLLRAEARRGIAPRDVLRNVNQQLLGMNVGLFVTVLYGVLNFATKDFTYVRAGHELPVIFDAGGELVHLQRGHGQLMGILDEPVLDEQNVRLSSGGTLFLFTDGVNEASNLQGELYGVARLQEAVGGLCRASAQSMCDQILEQVAAHRDSVAQQDDITMLAVQIK